MKGLSRKAKIIFLLVAFAGGCFINYRPGELNIPKSIKIYHPAVGCYGVPTGHMLYKKGLKYYADDCEITREEYLRCVNKRLYKRDDEDLRYEAGTYINDEDKYNSVSGTVVRYKNLLGTYEWEELHSEDPYSEAIERIKSVKKTKDDTDENLSDYDKEKKQEEENANRIKYAWDDLCYKYKVKDSQIIIFSKPKDQKRSDYDWKTSAVYRGYNSDLNEEELDYYRLTRMVAFDNRLMGMGDFFDLDDWMALLAMSKIDEDSKEYKFARNKLRGAYEVGNLNDLGKTEKYILDKKIFWNKNFSKTWSRGDEVLHMYVDKKSGVAVAVIFKTDDHITRGLLLHEMNSIVRNKHKTRVWINMYFWVRLLIFVAIERFVFLYIGKRKKAKNIIKTKVKKVTADSE